MLKPLPLTGAELDLNDFRNFLARKYLELKLKHNGETMALLKEALKLLNTVWATFYGFHAS